MVKDLQLTVSGSTSEPVSVAELKAYLQLEGAAFDSVLSAFISSARKQVEAMTNASLIDYDAVAYMHFDGKDTRIPYYPIASVTSVEVTNDGETWETLTEFTDYIITGGDMKFINSLYSGLHRITYTLSASSIQALIEAVKAQAGYMWTHRDAANVSGLSLIAQMLIKPYIYAY